jgi:DNA-binding FadR family transcriptional regulator
MHQIRDKVVATGLADEIAFRLQAAILDGEFPPGTHLQQDELCARFGVSRTPVREALRKLQAQHLVDLVPNKGATVRTPSRNWRPTASSPRRSRRSTKPRRPWMRRSRSSRPTP